MRPVLPLALVSLLSLGLVACGSDDEDRYEGEEPGDCSNDADNDRDGLFDCKDDGCAGASNCTGGETDADTDPDSDTDTDSDTDADTDTDTVTDTDTTPETGITSLSGTAMVEPETDTTDFTLTGGAPFTYEAWVEVSDKTSIIFYGGNPWLLGVGNFPDGSFDYHCENWEHNLLQEKLPWLVSGR